MKLYAAHTTEGVAMNESAFCIEHFDNAWDDAIVNGSDDWDGKPPTLIDQHDDLECQQCVAEADIAKQIAAHGPHEVNPKRAYSTTTCTVCGDDAHQIGHGPDAAWVHGRAPQR